MVLMAAGATGGFSYLPLSRDFFHGPTVLGTCLALTNDLMRVDQFSYSFEHHLFPLEDLFLEAGTVKEEHYPIRGSNVIARALVMDGYVPGVPEPGRILGNPGDKLPRIKRAVAAGARGVLGQSLEDLTEKIIARQVAVPITTNDATPLFQRGFLAATLRGLVEADALPYDAAKGFADAVALRMREGIEELNHGLKTLSEKPPSTIFNLSLLIGAGLFAVGLLEYWTGWVHINASIMFGIGGSLMGMRAIKDMYSLIKNSVLEWELGLPVGNIEKTKAAMEQLIAERRALVSSYEDIAGLQRGSSRASSAQVIPLNRS